MVRGGGGRGDGDPGQRAGRDADGSFGVRVSFGDAAEYEVTVTDPADPAGEELLAWYFEEHLRYPFLDKDRERQAVAQIAAYGEDAVRAGVRRGRRAMITGGCGSGRSTGAGWR